VTDLDAILREYADALASAGPAPEPWRYLARVPEDERGELARRLEDLLAGAPRRRFDAEEFAAAKATPLLQGIAAAAGGRSGLWPALLPRLRNGARLKRSEVVERLARDLDAADRQQKVHRYYHEMEQGLLDPQGVSDRVLEALGRILGSSLETLRDAGRALAEPPGGTPAAAGPLFARTARSDPSYVASAPPTESLADAETWDEVDELFRGGAPD
jgi:hypothetical protein